MAEPLRIYWDANAFLSYLDDTVGRGPVLQDLLVRSGDAGEDLLIVTSTLSLAEVAFLAAEGTRRQPTAVELAGIDFLWSGRYGVEVIAIDREIALHARGLIRDAVPRGWRLKPPDAIHLATAALSGAFAFHTYDESLWKYGGLLGITVGEPGA